MRSIRYVAVLAGVLMGTLSLVPASAATVQNAPARVLGASIAPWTGNADTAAGRASLRELKSDHANTVSLVLPLCQATLTSDSIARCWDMPSDADITATIRYARSIGLNVMLNLHVDADDPNLWRANINPTNRHAWFTAYGGWAVHYGRLGQLAGASGFCIGTEMYHVSDPRANPGNTAAWVNYIIKPVRQVLIYLANQLMQKQG